MIPVPILLAALLFLGQWHEFVPQAIQGGQTDIVDVTTAAPEPVTVAYTVAWSEQPAAATDGATLLVVWRERPGGTLGQTYLAYAVSVDGLTWTWAEVPYTLDGSDPELAVAGPGHYRATFRMGGSAYITDYCADTWTVPVPAQRRAYLPLVSGW